MGRRIRYRPGRFEEPMALPGRVRERAFLTPKTITLIGVGWGLILVVIVVVGYFGLQSRKFQNDFAPLAGVCQGKWVGGASAYAATPGKHPAVVVKNEDEGWQLDTSLLSGYLPGAISAQSLAETQAVLCLDKDQTIYIERCPYGDEGDGVTHVIDRYYHQQEARLVEAKTGRVIATQTFMGNAPPVCHQTELFGSDKTVKLVGSDIPVDEIRSWASSHLFIE